MPRARPLAILLLVAALALAAPVAALAQGGVRASRAEVQRLEGQLAVLDARVGALAAEHNLAIDRLEEVTARLGRARRELAETRRAAEEANVVLTERLRSIYARGEVSDLEILLASGSVTELADVRALLDRIAERDARAVTTLRRARDRAAALRAQLTEDRAAAAQRAAELAARQQELATAVRRRQELLRGARRELRAAIAAERERRRREAALAAARKARATSGLPYVPSAAETAVLPGGTRHVFPIRGGARYTDDWLYPRPGGRVHQGIDLFATEGTPIIAVADGTLFRVGYNGLGGWRFWLRDAAGVQYYHAHLSAFAPAAREGAVVRQGTVLGYVGTSGDARGTPPHLHFEIHAGAGPVRPFPIVSAWPVVR
jgi:murein DD-endopeptidase MepM/ murein hydrolase activator NlpD